MESRDTLGPETGSPGSGHARAAGAQSPQCGDEPPQLPRDGERRRRDRRPRRLRRQQQPDRDHRRDRRDRRADEGRGGGRSSRTDDCGRFERRPDDRRQFRRRCDESAGCFQRGQRRQRPPSTTAAGSAVAGRAAAVTGPESTKVFIDGANITSEPVDNDFNRDLYCGGVAQHMSGLLRYDQDFNLVPDLAESYSNSGPVFTFKIRKGATWSDGQPIKAKDFVYSLRRQIDPRTGNGYGSFWDGVIKGAAEFSSAKARCHAIWINWRRPSASRRWTTAPWRSRAIVFAGLIPNQAAYTASVVAREDVVKKYADAKGVSSWTDPGQGRRPRPRQRRLPDHRVEAQPADRPRPQRQVLEREEHPPEVRHLGDHPGHHEEHAALRERRCGLPGHPGDGSRPLQEQRHAEDPDLPVRLSRHPLPRPRHRPSALRQARSPPGDAPLDRQGPARQSGRQEDPHHRLRHDRARRLRLLRRR